MNRATISSSSSIAGVLGVFLILSALPASGQAPDERSSTQQRDESVALFAHGNQLSQAGRFDEAVTLVERSLELERRRGARNGRRVAVVLTRLAELHELQGDWNQALARAQEAETIRERLYGKDHWQTASSRLAAQFAERVSHLGPSDRAKIQALLAKEDHAVELAGRGKLADGERAALEALVTYQDLLGPEAPEVAKAWNRIGLIRLANGDARGAKYANERALVIRRKSLRPDHPLIAVSLNNLGNAEKGLEEFAAAQRCYEVALAIRRRVFPPGHLDIAASLNNLGVVDYDLADYAAARRCHELALAIRRNALPAGHLDIAQSLNNLGVVQLDMSDFTAAKQSQQEALAIRRKALPPGHLKIAESLNNLAAVLTGSGEHAAAKANEEEALAMRRAALPPGHPAIAQSLVNLGNTHEDLGNYAAALKCLQDALEIFRKAYPNGHTDVATCLSDLGVVQNDIRDYTGAKKSHEDALAIRRKMLPPDHPDIGSSLNGLGSALCNLRDFPAAKRAFEEALAIFQRVPPKENLQIAAILNNLGVVQSELEDESGAKGRFEAALAIHRKVLPPGHVDIALSLANLGRAQNRSGESLAAKRSHEEALAIRRKALPEGHPDIADSLNSLGVVQKDMGEYAAAAASLREALAVCRRSLPKNDPDIAGTLQNLGYLALVSGIDGEETFGRLVEAADIYQAEQFRLSIAQAESQQLSSSRRAGITLQLLMNATLTANASATGAYDRVVRGKGSVTTLQRWAHEARDTADQDTKNLINRLRDVSQEIVTLSVVRPPRQRSTDSADESELRRARSEERAAIERQLIERSEVYRNVISRSRVGCKEIGAALPAGTALIDLVEFWHVARKGQEPVPVEQRLMAFVLRSGAPGPVMVPLDSSETIINLIDGWRKTYGAGKRAPAGEPDPGAELRKRIWEPVAAHLGDAKVVLISPDGPLNGLPWAALPGFKPGTFLVHEYTFAVVPVTQLLPDRREAARERSAGPSALVMGNIDFDAVSGPADRLERINNFGFLPGTMAEAEAVDRLFRKAFPGRKPTLLSGKEATKDAFLTHAPDCSHLEIATHGFFQPEPKPAERAEQSYRRLPDNLMLERDSVTEKPALRSGLVFAGANYQAMGRGPGFLTALEASELDLRRADLAVLSACETGLGKVAAGEGVLGLQRAFQVAGAGTMVTSLWKVPDGATQSLMTRFHQNLWEQRKQRMAKAEALREAQIWLIHEGPSHPELLRSGLEPADPEPQSGQPLSPYFWAAFVLSGDWQ